jgi:hypothetical protein
LHRSALMEDTFDLLVESFFFLISAAGFFFICW